MCQAVLGDTQMCVIAFIVLLGGHSAQSEHVVAFIDAIARRPDPLRVRLSCFGQPLNQRCPKGSAWLFEHRKAQLIGADASEVQLKRAALDEVHEYWTYGGFFNLRVGWQRRLSDLTVLNKGISGDAFKPLSGDDKALCKDLAKLNQQGNKQLEKDYQSRQSLFDFSDGAEIQQALKLLESMPADTPQEVDAKEVAYREFLSQRQNHKLAKVADLALAAFLLPKTNETLGKVPTSQNVHAELTETASTTAHQEVLDSAQQACREASVFHWPIAFAQVPQCLHFSDPAFSYACSFDCAHIGKALSQSGSRAFCFCRRNGVGGCLTSDRLLGAICSYSCTCSCRIGGNRNASLP